MSREWDGPACDDPAERPYDYDGLYDDVDYLDALDISTAHYFIAPCMPRACGCPPDALFTTACCWTAELARIRGDQPQRDRGAA